MANDLSSDLASLNSGTVSTANKVLPSAKQPTPIPERVGSSGRVNTARGGGIASPLTESDTVARDFWPEKTLVSTDGLIYAKYKPLKRMTMSDATGAQVVFNFQNP